MDISRLKYSCSEEEWQRHLREEEENSREYFKNGAMDLEEVDIFIVNNYVLQQ